VRWVHEVPAVVRAVSSGVRSPSRWVVGRAVGYAGGAVHRGQRRHRVSTWRGVMMVDPPPR